MDTWIDQLAGLLGEDRLSEEEISQLLSVARDVAHGVERRITPLSTFLLGAAVGRSQAGGAGRHEAIEAVMDPVRSILPARVPE
jgi:hypothetical protein